MLKSKLLGSFLLVLGSLPVLAVDGDFSGQYRLRASANMAADSLNGLFDENPTLSGLDTRVVVSGSFRPSEAFEGSVTLYTNLNSPDLELVPMAYGDWMISDEFTLRSGRFTYSIGDGSVIGKNKYENVPVFFDGLFLNHSSEMLVADIILAKGHNVNVAQEGVEGADSDVDTLGIVSLEARSLPELLSTLNVHIIAPVSSLSDARAGVTVGGGSLGVGYKLTAAVSSLSENDLGAVADQFMIDGKVSYSHDLDNGTVKVHLGGHVDTAQYDPLFYDVFKKSGKLQMLQWGSGIQYVKAGISYRQDADFGVGLTGYHVLSIEDSVNGVDEGTTEVDVYVKKVFNSSVSGKIWIGTLVDSEGNAQLLSQAVAKMRF